MVWFGANKRYNFPHDTLFICIIYHRYNINMEDCKREGLGWGSRSSHPICISEFSATIKPITDKILEGKRQWMHHHHHKGNEKSTTNNHTGESQRPPNFVDLPLPLFFLYLLAATPSWVTSLKQALEKCGSQRLFFLCSHLLLEDLCSLSKS